MDAEIYGCLNCGSYLQLEEIRGDTVEGEIIYGCPFCLRWNCIQKIEKPKDLKEVENLESEY
ncbi:MAG: hypothetical protein ABEJ03_06310 [Candidatus Nanohaloarchaea archaeon]